MEANSLANHYGFDINHLQSIVFIQNGRMLIRSSAVLRVFRYMDGLWPLLSILLIVPVPVRDFIYDIIARNRYRWFGKCESCVTD